MTSSSLLLLSAMSSIEVGPSHSSPGFGEAFELTLAGDFTARAIADGPGPARSIAPASGSSRSRFFRWRPRGLFSVGRVTSPSPLLLSTMPVVVGSIKPLNRCLRSRRQDSSRRERLPTAPIRTKGSPQRRGARSSFAGDRMTISPLGKGNIFVVAAALDHARASGQAGPWRSQIRLQQRLQTAAYGANARSLCRASD